MKIHVSGNKIISCLKNCKDCPALQGNWSTILHSPCCENILIAARHQSLAKRSNGTVDKCKALKYHLKELELI